MRLFVRFASFVVLAGMLWAQRSDRASITGIVTDPSGNAAAGITVKVRNDNTGVETPLVTNAAGAYTSPLLVLGTYTVTVEAPGFKTAVFTGIDLSGGQVYRQDAVLQLGSVSESVTVSAAADVLNTTTADVAHTVGETYYRNLPVVMGADIRLAEALLQIQPGYTPMKPNGDPMFRGSQFSSRMNGGQSFAMENFFDGVAFGYAAGHNQSHESAPPIESVGEMRVITASYSAQYGHTSGGTVEYVSRAGTKEYHGSLYHYFANDALNARGFFPDRPFKQRSNAYGVTFGGPVNIPKVYDGRNKTFFFLNFDWLKFRSGHLPGFGNTTPIGDFKQGNFSQLLTGRQIATDALGRAVMEGAIFDPNSTRNVNGVPVRDPFLNNVIPANHPLRSQVAAKYIPLMKAPDRPGLQFNVAGNPAGDQTWIANFRTIVTRIDHQATDKLKMTTSFFWPHRPAIRNCGEVLGCTPSFDPEANKDYIGNGFQQRIATHHATQQFDYIIRNNLLWHGTASWDRWYMGGTPLSAQQNWPTRLWGSQERSGLVDSTAGAPNITFTGNIPYTQLGMQWIGNGFEAINRWQFQNDLTWVTGKHSIKVGFEFRHHQFNFQGWAASTGGQFNFNRLTTGGFDARGNNLNLTGDPFASFILGQVQTGSFTIPLFSTFNGNTYAAYINDDFKVTPKLNLTLGLRFDYQSPWTERHDRISTFSPTAPNPTAGGRPGALIFGGSGPGRVGRRNFDDQMPIDAFGPRFGFAYRVNELLVVRGGYGIYYAGLTFGQGPQPTTGFSSSNVAANVTNGLTPTFHLDSGFPREAVAFPPFINPSFANGTAVAGYPGDGNTQPRYQNWSFTIQKQFGETSLVDVSYIGNRGTRLPHHPQFLGVLSNMNDPAVLNLGAALLQSDINSPAARAANIPIPYAGFRGNVAQALRPYPQYQAIDWRSSPLGKSIFHSLQVKYDKRFSEGLQLRTFWVWSKLLNNRAESGQRGGTGVQNPINTQAGEWGLSSDDVPHSFVVSWTYELPIAKNAKGFLKAVGRGWTVNGMLRYETGRPLPITMFNDLGGLLFNGSKRPNRTAGFDGITAFDKFDPNAMRYLNSGGWFDPGPLGFGNAAPRDGSVRGFRNYVEDVSLFKVTPLAENVRLRIEIQGGNFTNRVVFCDPDTNWSSPSFGRVATQCNQPRSVQLGMKLEF
ncbi:MAG TPA: hypothetical protein DEH78_11965 [Solibacterales bacterium]|nr:hypothetical protein [Bryobacterales bacterium]